MKKKQKKSKKRKNLSKKAQKIGFLLNQKKLQKEKKINSI